MMKPIGLRFRVSGRLVLWCSILAAWLLVAPIADGAEGAERPDPQRWAADMQAFEESDRLAATPPGGIVFVGSSTIRLWKVSESFPDLKPLNRGFGGSVYADILPHFDLLIARHRPRIVVVYSGDNDIAQGLTPKQVADDFRQLSDKLRESLPECRLICLAIKPSRERWSMYPAMQDANRRLEAICREHPHGKFLDVGPEMLGSDGLPRTELLQDDGLHLNEQGYELWSQKLRPLLEADQK